MMNKEHYIKRELKRTWILLEAGYEHTAGLTKAEAEKMLERYQRIFPEIEYCIVSYE